MIVGYQRKADRAAIIWLASVAVLIALPLAAKAAGFALGDAALAILIGANFLVLGYASWAYAKAKGYSSVTGIALPLFLHLLGLVILLCLKDKHPQSTASRPVS